ncbi:4'-phosphopantetheinyl transferase family protein [Streptomyces sp. NPDC090036]|uniref:4'-phosphopantetheinyl transferase family protein n=1 Tax=Streptomyces sp. NPDC090036 TaxID=3365926 RepID=UPI0037FCF2DA
MITHVNQLGPETPHTGPAPTGTQAIVWSLDTTAHTIAGHHIHDAHTILDTEERTKAARFLQPDDRHRYTASHVALRILLGKYLNQPPQHITLTREPCPTCGGPHGRPALTHPNLHFSLSHSGNLAYIALAATPVGIDIEQTPTPQTVNDIINTLHPTETAELNALAPHQQPPALARLWARKEACLKATGTGLAQGLTHPYVSTHPTPPPTPGWTLTDLPAPHGYTAALALTQPPTHDPAHDPAP